MLSSFRIEELAKELLSEPSSLSMVVSSPLDTSGHPQGLRIALRWDAPSGPMEAVLGQFTQKQMQSLSQQGMESLHKELSSIARILHALNALNSSLMLAFEDSYTNILTEMPAESLSSVQSE